MEKKIGAKHKRDLKEAYENLLVIAKRKLEHAKNKKNEWDIEHYKGDIKLIESELEIVNKI